MDKDYKTLDLYQKADRLVLSIYKVTKSFPKDELFGIVSQMRRAAVSVVANFVEGYGRKGLKEKIQFYYMSLGSLNELEYYIGLSYKISFLTKEDYEELSSLRTDVAKLFSGYIRGLRENSVGYELRATSYQSGQTLIETIIGIFIFVTGIMSGLGLAIYSFSASSDIVERITAISLAREGVEAVRRMRDSNWIAARAGDELENCNDIESGQLCYRDWLSQTFDIDPGGSPQGRDYRLRVSVLANRLDLPGNPCLSNANSKWCLYQVPGGPVPADYYQLQQIVSPPSETWRVRFTHPPYAFGDVSTPSNFFRKITIVQQSTDPPYSAANAPLILVRSTVWWYGKGCNNTLTDLTDLNQTPCKVVSEEFLTNWRNY